MEAAEKIAAFAESHQLTMAVKFIPWSQSRNKGEKNPSLNWEVTILHKGRPIIRTDYMKGAGHCPSYKQTWRPTVDDMNAIRLECETGKKAISAAISGGMSASAKPITVDIVEVLACLASDASAIDYPEYETWASDLGYDEDSRQGEKIYRACLEIGLKLRAALGEQGLQELREACQDY